VSIHFQPLLDENGLIGSCDAVHHHPRGRHAIRESPFYGSRNGFERVFVMFLLWQRFLLTTQVRAARLAPAADPPPQAVFFLPNLRSLRSQLGPGPSQTIKKRLARHRCSLALRGLFVPFTDKIARPGGSKRRILCCAKHKC
jgi:hypothetical protein